MSRGAYKHFKKQNKTFLKPGKKCSHLDYILGKKRRQNPCQAIPSPMIKKSQYRTQLTVPVPTIDPFMGCNPLGKSTFFWESMREIPVSGEDFNYLIWRKRNCCAL